MRTLYGNIRMIRGGELAIGNWVIRMRRQDGIPRGLGARSARLRRALRGGGKKALPYVRQSCTYLWPSPIGSIEPGYRAFITSNAMWHGIGQLWLNVKYLFIIDILHARYFKYGIHKLILEFSIVTKVSSALKHIFLFKSLVVEQLILYFLLFFFKDAQWCHATWRGVGRLSLPAGAPRSPGTTSCTLRPRCFVYIFTYFFPKYLVSDQDEIDSPSFRVNISKWKNYSRSLDQKGCNLKKVLCR